MSSSVFPSNYKEKAKIQGHISEMLVSRLNEEGETSSNRTFFAEARSQDSCFWGADGVCGLMCNVGTLLIASLHPFLPPSHADNIKRCPNTSAFSPVLLLL